MENSRWQRLLSLRGDFDGRDASGACFGGKGRERHQATVVSRHDLMTAARADAARLEGVGLQTIRDWVLRFNFRGPDGLVDDKSTGHPSKLNDEQRRALVAMVEAGTTAAVHGVVRWRLIDLAQWVFDEYRISVTEQILSRELRALGYRKSLIGAAAPPRA